MKLKSNKPTNHEHNDRLHSDAAIKTWWSAMRWKYNKGLVLAGVLAFVIYATVASILLAPYEPDFEITLFTIVFQGFWYLFMMLIANLFYNLGPMMDRLFNRDNNQEFRELLYNLGYWFSFCLPFLIPILVVIRYLVAFG